MLGVLGMGATSLTGCIPRWQRTFPTDGWFDNIHSRCIAVTPANIYMLHHADLFSVPHWVLVVRLPVQAALLALIWWSCVRGARRAVDRG